MINCSLCLENVSMNTSINASGEWNSAARIVVTFLSLMLAVIIFSGNLLVIVAFAVTKSLRREIDLYIVSLAIADFLLSIVVLPLGIARQYYGYWPFQSNLLCQFYLSVNLLVESASVFSMCCISVDRYIAVTHPLQYNRTRNYIRPICLLGGTWLLSITSTLLSYICGYQHFYIEVFYWLIPIMIIGCTHFMIFIAIRRHSIRRRQLYSIHNVKVHHNHLLHARKRLTDTVMTYFRNPNIKLTKLSHGNIDIPMFINSWRFRFKIFCKMSLSDQLSSGNIGSRKHHAKHIYPTQISVHVHPEVVDTSNREVTNVDSNSQSFYSIETDLTENRITLNQIRRINMKHQATAQCGQRCDEGCESPSILENSHQIHYRNCNHKIVDNGNKESSLPSINRNIQNKFSLRDHIQRQTTFKRELRTVKNMAIVIFCFLFCWLPYLPLHLGEIFCNCMFSETLIMSSVWFMYLNSGCNPFIYAFHKKPYANAYRRLLNMEKYHR
ncbi:Octopamine receptor [Schistosoma japonicum]|nr:Octopamine receptor [Schistosoma japonicum]